ncbi:MAG TPA: hypothetical protein VN673_11485 [Clostridia bacterium]|nr:hypothetical protein [Clostridia bacterium]
MADTNEHTITILRRFRFVLGLFILALFLSGITAFPLAREMEVLASMAGVNSPPPPGGYSGLQTWIATVHHGLAATYAEYPWMAYGTDWLAFAHIIIAIFFVGPLIDPVRNVWVIKAGLIACVLVLPLALICGPLRGIPFGWRLIDCSFGVFGALPLLYCLRQIRKLEPAPPGRVAPH